MSISDKLREYKQASYFRFHTPGHKGALSGEDITELFFSDDYFNPQGIIRDAMNLCRDFFLSRECFLLTGGSTLGILSAVYAVRPKTLALARNSHISAFNAAKLAGATTYIIENELKDGIAYPLSVQAVEKAINSNKIDALLLTSPDYFGLCADTKRIYQICKENDVVLIVDSAHGAHFNSCDLFPTTYGDIIVSSGHKTMPALTMGAYLNVYDQARVEDVRNALYTFASTSPSYLVMSSLEYAVEYTMQCAGYYYHLAELAAPLHQKYNALANADFTRLVVRTTDKDADKKLREHGVVSEKVFGDYIIFILTLADNAQTIAALDKALEGIT